MCRVKTIKEEDIYQDEMEHLLYQEILDELQEYELEDLIDEQDRYQEHGD